MYLMMNLQPLKASKTVVDFSETVIPPEKWRAVERSTPLITMQDSEGKGRHHFERTCLRTN